jgi:phospholipid transport system substrate-binding protein
MLLLCPGAWAGPPTERLRGFFGSATRILDTLKTQEKPEEGLGAIRAIVSDVFDFREAARLSLGPNWSGRTPAEREEFVSLFANLLERSLTIGIAARIHLSDGVKVSYLDEAIDGAVATVWTTIVTKSGLDLPFNYRMIERGDRWAVRDVVIDGVSLAANYSPSSSASYSPPPIRSSSGRSVRGCRPCRWHRWWRPPRPAVS